MRILTFNHHEPYIATLALTGHDFDVVTRYKSLELTWNSRTRAMPANLKSVEFNAIVKQRLRDGYYDLVICHTVKNLMWIWLFFKPRYIFVAHIPLFTNTLSQRLKSLGKKITWLLFKWSHKSQFFAVSDFKLNSWKESGHVAVLAPGEFPPLRTIKGTSDVLIICNDLKNRGEELGLDMITRLSLKAPIHVVGRNPGISFSKTPKDFADFQSIVTGYRIYLYTIKMPWGDGYNTAMLEAMRMGMAIVTVENPSSPIKHGKNGLIGKTEDQLLEHINKLRGDPELIDTLGRAAQETIRERFSEKNFIDTWQSVINKAAL